MDTSAMLSRDEQNSLLALSLHNMLLRKDLVDEARIAWVLYLNSSANAEGLGEALGLEVEVA